MSRCFDQNNYFLVPNSDVNAAFCSKSPSENNSIHQHTKNSNTSSIEFRSDGIILHDMMH